MTNLITSDITSNSLQLLRLFTKESIFDWSTTIVSLANDCPELIALDIKMGGGFLPTVNSNMNQLQKDFIVVFSHIEDYTPELLESLIAVFMRCKDSK